MIFDRVLVAHLLIDRFVCNTLSHVVQRNKHKYTEVLFYGLHFFIVRTTLSGLRGKKETKEL